MNCPKCPVGNLNEVTIRVDNLYRAKVLQGEGRTLELKLDQCFVCNGVWFDAGELDKYLAEQINIMDSPEVDRSLMEELNQKVGKCPRCQIDMAKKQAPKDPKVTIDFCEKCQGIWLDTGEIDRLESKNLGEKKKFILELEELFSKFFKRGDES